MTFTLTFTYNCSLIWPLLDLPHLADPSPPFKHLLMLSWHIHSTPSPVPIFSLKPPSFLWFLVFFHVLHVCAMFSLIRSVSIFMTFVLAVSLLDPALLHPVQNVRWKSLEKWCFGNCLYPRMKKKKKEGVHPWLLVSRLILSFNSFSSFYHNPTTSVVHQYCWGTQDAIIF